MDTGMEPGGSKEPSPPTEAPTRRSRQRRWLVAGVALLVATVAGLGTLLYLRGGGASRRGGPSGNQLTTVDHSENNVGDFSSIAIGADGLPVISYLDFTAFQLKVVHCNDPACAGEDETITAVEGSAGGGFYTSIAIGRDGFPVISFADARAGVLKVAHCNDPACAGRGQTITTIGGPAGGGSTPGDALYTSIAIGSDGLPVISYHDFVEGDLKAAHCNDAACTGEDETITTIIDESPGHAGSATSIAIGSDGLPMIAFLDFDAGDLKVIHCNDPACAGEDQTISTVDDLPLSQQTTSPFISLAIGADGLPVVSYMDRADGIRVAHCNDPKCTGRDETITTVDSGFDPSIDIGVDGLPVISYVGSDFVEGNRTQYLKVAHCNDAACTGGDEAIIPVDAEKGHAYLYTSIAIGADGLPVISYQDGTAGALKVAHLAA